MVTYKIKEQTADEIYNTIAEGDRNEYAMIANCRDEYFNLVTGHVYTVLGVLSLTNGPRLVKLRNPWGSEQYTGPFKDDGDEWTDAWKQEAGLVVADDGIFHMPIDDFVKPFSDDYSILMYRDDWNTETTRITGTGQVFKQSITSECDQDIVLTFEYQNPRQIPKGCEQPDLLYNFYIGSDQTPRVVSGQMGYGYWEMSMKAGEKVPLEVYNWKDTTYNTDLVAQTWGPSCAAKFS